MKNVVELALDGVKLIDLNHSADYRGRFTKTFHAETFLAAGIHFTEQEEFYSVSSKHVFRGMHFQKPPFAHQKLVHCIQGEVLDVLLDLRLNSSTYGQILQLPLSQQLPQLLYIPMGIAHGFLVLSEQATLLYKTDRVYSHEHDCGLFWGSLGLDLPVSSPIISERDQQFDHFSNFKSPF